MKKLLTFVLIIGILIPNIFVHADEREDSLLKDYEVTMRQDLLSLMLAYPNEIVNIEVDSEGFVYIITKSGEKIIYDDKKVKTYEEKLSNSDIQDSMEQVYPLKSTEAKVEENYDPGRFRPYKLLHEIYGKDRISIEENLTKVKLGHKNHLFNQNNEASYYLEKTVEQINILISKNKGIKKFVFPTSGTYNYRFIDKTQNLSPHAFGIAIDLAYAKGDYWKWSSKEESEKRLAEYPRELVKAFEENNFVWGGKWDHYDILHFEYRPEIIIKAKFFEDKNNTEQMWYNGAPEDDKTKECIIKINTALGDREYSEEEIANKIIKIFVNRNRALITKDISCIESMYDRNTKYGMWAYEFEKRKMDYIDNWQQKQGAKFIEINPDVVVRKITKKSDDAYSIYVTCSTEYKYIYEDKPTEINRCKTGTYHVLRLIKKDGTWVIAKEWYKDPFGDSLDLGTIKADSVKEFIVAQGPRDLSNLNERRKSAMEYAFKYLGAANDKEVGYQYNKAYKNYNSEGGDCANFASQILFEGGQFRKTKGWNYGEKGGNRGWLNADGFKEYMINSGRASLIAYGSYDKVVKSSYKLLPGDFVAYECKGDITHISMVSGADSKGYTLVSCHNADRNNVPWDLGWSNKKIRFWLVRVHY